MMERPEGYPISDIKLPAEMINSLFESPFFHRNDDCDDLSIMESGRLYRRTYSDIGDDHHRLQERAKRLGISSFDPRLFVLLEFFRQFYVRREELLKKIFPGLQHEFIEYFRKVGNALAEVKLNQMQVKTMQRSLSLGSPRTPSNKGDESPLRLERFRIRTVKVGGDEVPVGGQGGQGSSNPSGSK